MPGFTLTTRTCAPVEEVWKLLFDPMRFPEWWAGVETVRVDDPDAYTLWPDGYPDFPMPQTLRTDADGHRVTISCLVSDLVFEWQLEPLEADVQQILAERARIIEELRDLVRRLGAFSDEAAGRDPSRPPPSEEE